MAGRPFQRNSHRKNVDFIFRENKVFSLQSDGLELAKTNVDFIIIFVFLSLEAFYVIAKCKVYEKQMLIYLDQSVTNFTPLREIGLCSISNWTKY